MQRNNRPVVADAQKPMTQRAEEMMEELWKYNGRRTYFLDQKVLKHLIKKGRVILVNVGSPRQRKGNYQTVTSHRTAVALESKPEEVNEKPAGPYAKRRADQTEAGLSLRGKNWGKVRVDLPREERERKIAEKREMWEKLSYKKC